MIAYIKRNRIIALIIAISIISAAFLVWARTEEENKNKNVTLIMDYIDIVSFSIEADMPVKEVLAGFADAGITGIVIRNPWYFFPERYINNVKEAGMKPILRTLRDISVDDYDELCKKYDIDFPIYLSYRYLRGDADEYMMENNITVALVENSMQSGHEDLRQFDADNSEVSLVRVFQLLKGYSLRYGVLGYEGAEEIENVLYRAVSDRNIRVLWITPFYDNETEEMITDISEYKEVFENLARRMEPHGLVLGDTFSSVEPYTPSPILTIICFFGIAALAVVLVGTLVPMSENLRLILSLSLGAVASLLYFIVRGFSLTSMALIIVSIMPCFAVYFTLKQVKRLTEKRLGFLRAMLYALMSFAIVIAILLVGGSFVGGILGESHYMLEFEIFRGVKVSQMIPLLYTALIIVKEFIYKKGKTVTELATELVGTASRSKKLLVAFVIVAIIGAVALFIVRTGNTILQAGELEQKFRIFFEVTCVARPRTKEFLIAWPAFFVCFFLFARDKKILGSIALFASSIGCASVCNTFCHIRAYYLLSVIRTGYGAAFGIALGIILSIVCLAFFSIVERKKS